MGEYEKEPLPPGQLQDGGQIVDHRDGRDVVIRVRGLRTQFGDQVVHDHLDFDVFRGEVCGLVGGSGSGKSVLLRTIIGLNHPRAGSIEILGTNTRGLHSNALLKLQRRWGVLFQDGALFSSLTVAENIMVPLREHAGLDEETLWEVAALKVAITGLSPDAACKTPSELSGGMRKRAALARALALDPELLFLDEPTAGLDPISAGHFDQLIRSLQKSLGLTVLMVTHDIDSLVSICDRIAVLLDKRVVVGTMDELLKYDHPWVKEYFHGPRGRAARKEQMAADGK
jgi:phospholipid/cholesterol/gamma-HCH transport system ATP-binding protein